MNLRNIAIWGVIIVLAVVVYSVMQGQTHSPASPQDLAYSDLLAKVDQGDVAKVNIHGPLIDVTDKAGHDYKVTGPSDNDPELEKRLTAHNVKLSFQQPGPGILMQLVWNMLPLALFALGWIFIVRQMQGGARGAMGFVMFKARVITENKNRVTFEDVAGVD